MRPSAGDGFPTSMLFALLIRRCIVRIAEDVQVEIRRHWRSRQLLFEDSAVQQCTLVRGRCRADVRLELVRGDLADVEFLPMANDVHDAEGYPDDRHPVEIGEVDLRERTRRWTRTSGCEVLLRREV